MAEDVGIRKDPPLGGLISSNGLNEEENASGFEGDQGISDSSDCSDSESSDSSTYHSESDPEADELFAQKVLQILMNIKSLSTEPTRPIILGNVLPQSDVMTPVPIQIVLEDCSEYLKKSVKFCDDCGILFPDRDALDTHKSLYHCLVVDIATDPVVDDTSKRNDALCGHCNNNFDSRELLERHMHKVKAQERENKSERRIKHNESGKRKRDSETASSEVKEKRSKNDATVNSEKERKHEKHARTSHRARAEDTASGPVASGSGTRNSIPSNNKSEADFRSHHDEKGDGHPSNVRNKTPATDNSDKHKKSNNLIGHVNTDKIRRNDATVSNDKERRHEELRKEHVRISHGARSEDAASGPVASGIGTHKSTSSNDKRKEDFKGQHGKKDDDHTPSVRNEPPATDNSDKHKKSNNLIGHVNTDKIRNDATVSNEKERRHEELRKEHVRISHGARSEDAASGPVASGSGTHKSTSSNDKSKEDFEGQHGKKEDDHTPSVRTKTPATDNSDKHKKSNNLIGHINTDKIKRNDATVTNEKERRHEKLRKEHLRTSHGAGSEDAASGPVASGSGTHKSTSSNDKSKEDFEGQHGKKEDDHTPSVRTKTPATDNSGKHKKSDDHIGRVNTDILIFKKKQPQYTEFIPKDAIFECIKCSINVFNCIVGLSHWKTCRTQDHHVTPKVWTCSICSKKFRLQDRTAHQIQHKEAGGGIRCYAADFQELYSKVLFKCDRCDVYFEERRFLLHRKTECDRKKPPQKCRLCDVYICKLDKHEMKHEIDKWTKSDFIFIDDFIATTTKSKDAVSQKSAIRNSPIANDPKSKSTGSSETRAKTYTDADSTKTDYDIFYNCKTCNLTLNGYDRVVYHCQKHINYDNYVPTSRQCTICSLVCEDVCLIKHDKSSRRLTKTLTFDYSNLLKANWFDLFASLPADKAQKIKAASIFVTRAVKMRVHSNNRARLKLYKCEACTHFVDPSDVLEHSRRCQGNGDNAFDYSCKICSIKLTNTLGLQNHAKDHDKGQVTLSSYKIIAFNKKEDKKFNKKLELFSKESPVDESKDVGISNMLEVNQEFARNVDKIYFFQCVTCKSSSPKLVFINGHKCKTYIPNAKKCTQCDFVSIPSNMASHQKWHEDNKTITSGDIRMIPFEEGKVVTSNGRARYTYLQCLDCKILFHNGHESCNLVQHKCNICEYAFGNNGIGFHMHKHRLHTDMTRNTILIIPVNPRGDTIRPKGIDYSESEDDVDEACARDVMYKCESCRCIFASRRDFVHHIQDMCYLDCGVKCNLCDLVFEKNAYHIHKDKHGLADDGNTKLHKIVTLKKADVKDYTLFKCEKCKEHFVSRAPFYKHLKSGCNYGGVKCGKCGLKFNKFMRNIHIKLHHERQNYKADDFHVITSKLKKINVKGLKKASDRSADNMSASKIAKQRNMQTKNRVQRSGVISYDRWAIRKAVAVLPKHRNHLMVAKNTRKLRHSYTNPTNELFKCVKCGIHFLKPSTLELHLKSSCKVIRKSRCKICNYVFTSASLNDHLIIHHDRMKLGPRDFKIIKFTSSTVTSFSKTKKIATKTRPHLAYLRGPDTEPDLTNSIFVCGNCRLFFVTKAAMYAHIKKNHLVCYKAIHCDDCGLRFICNSYTKHIAFHHKKYGYTIKDLHIFEARDAPEEDFDARIVNSEPIDCDDSTDAEDEVPISDSNDSSALVSYQSSATKITIKKSKRHTSKSESDFSEESTKDFERPGPSGLKTESRTAETVAYSFKTAGHEDVNCKNKRNTNTSLLDDDSSAESAPSNVGSKSPNGLSNIKCEFHKCKECNIHFLRAKACRKHMHNHTPCESWNYVVCNICKLHFQVDCIKKHAREHHGINNIGLDAILIHEYRLVDGVLKIESYRAKDTAASAVIINRDASNQEQSLTPNEPSASLNSEVNKVLDKDSTTSEKDKITPAQEGIWFKDVMVAIKVENIDGLLYSPTSGEHLSAAENNNSSEGGSKSASVVRNSRKVSTNEGSIPKEYPESSRAIHKDVCSSSRAKIHESLEYIDAIMECPICRNSYNKSIWSEMHLNIATGQFTCCLCRKRFIIDIMNQHASFHHNF